MRSVCVCVALSILCFTLARTVTAQGKSQSDSYVLPNIGSLTPIFLFGDSVSGSTNFYFIIIIIIIIRTLFIEGDT